MKEESEKAGLKLNIKKTKIMVCTITSLIEAEVPILWPPDAKSQLTGKDPDARKDCGQEEKG